MKKGEWLTGDEVMDRLKIKPFELLYYVKEGLNFQSLICVPLDYKGKAVGVMAIYDRKVPGGFTEDEQTLLKDVALQTAMAISNYQLNIDVEKAYLETIRALAMAVEAKDPAKASLLTEGLLGDTARMEGMREAAKVCGNPGASYKIAEMMMGLSHGKR